VFEVEGVAYEKGTHDDHVQVWWVVWQLLERGGFRGGGHLGESWRREWDDQVTMKFGGVIIRGDNAMKYPGKTVERATRETGRPSFEVFGSSSLLSVLPKTSGGMLQLTDDYTLYLLVGAGIAYVVHKLALPRALLHPLLLGRQAHVSQVRVQGESAIYRNYGLGTSPVCIALYFPGCHCSSRSSSQRRPPAESRRCSISYAENRHMAPRRGGSGV
jgi:hypothetical protein